MTHDNPQALSPSHMTLSELVEAIGRWRSDQNLWSEFFYRFGYLVRTQMRLHGRDLMKDYEQDMIQDACLKFICEFDKVQPDREGLLTYIKKIIRSSIEDFRRHLRFSDREESLIADHKRAQAGVDRASLINLWTDICAYFPDRKDRAIVKQIWAEATIPEIAANLGVSEYQVKRARARLERALTRLRTEKSGASAK